MTEIVLDADIVGKKRYVPIENKLASLNDATRTVEFVLSTERSDRVRDVVKLDGWDLKEYRKNPVVLWCHDHRIPPIGRMVKIGVKDKALAGAVQFATVDEHPFADTIYRLVKGGYISAGSVGFMPKKVAYNEDRRGFDIDEAELFEYSIVGVPMNPDARAKAGADLGAECVEKAIAYLKSIEVPAESAPIADVPVLVGRYAQRAAIAVAKTRI